MHSAHLTYLALLTRQATLTSISLSGLRSDLTTDLRGIYTVFPRLLSNLSILTAYLAPPSTCANTTDHELPQTRPLLTRPAHTFARARRES